MTLREYLPVDPATLAAAPATRVLLWVGVVVVILLIGGIMAFWLRRRYLDESAEHTDPGTLSLHELRSLHASGELSDEEFEALRDAALRAHGKAAAPDPGAALRAEPGLDLTGDPLPDSGRTNEDEGGQAPTPEG